MKQESLRIYAGECQNNVQSYAQSTFVSCAGFYLMPIPDDEK